MSTKSSGRESVVKHVDGAIRSRPISCVAREPAAFFARPTPRGNVFRRAAFSNVRSPPDFYRSGRIKKNPEKTVGRYENDRSVGIVL